MEKRICLAVFDGSRSNRFLIRELFKQISKNGIFLEASNGLESIEVIKENYIDICFVNLFLSKIEGKKVAKILKDKNINTRVIALNSICLSLEEIENDSNFDSTIRIGESVTVSKIKEELFKISEA